MTKIRDMVHGRCSQMGRYAAADGATAGVSVLALCPCPGFQSQDSLGLGAVCVHCGHLRVQHNRTPVNPEATEVER